jgi:hypothetical protein
MAYPGCGSARHGLSKADGFVRDPGREKGTRRNDEEIVKKKEKALYFS